MINTFFGKDGFIWWKGVVEDRKDPIFLGRVRVRIFGWHTENKSELPTSDLPWAMISLPGDNGGNPVGLREGDWCWGFFLDGKDAQRPVVVGHFAGINEDAADSNSGFYDPTTPEELESGAVPRPPRMVARNIGEPVLIKAPFLRMIAKLSPPAELKAPLVKIVDALFLQKNVLPFSELPQGIASAVTQVFNTIDETESAIIEEVKSQIQKAADFILSKIIELQELIKEEIAGAIESASSYADSAILPGTNLAFGELRETFDITKSKFDVDKNGEFNLDDAELLIEQALADGGFFDGYADVIPEVPASAYPLADRLNEPSTSRLSRNENVEQTIVGLKRTGELTTIKGAGFSGNTLGGAEDPETSFTEPQSPYAAQYPYNHVYESESGHVTEIDDTPNAERLHWYHKSGTFTEIHPNGIEVNKIVNSQYDLIAGDYFNQTKNAFHVDATKGIKLKSGANCNIQSTGSLNQQVGNSLNSKIGKDKTSHIGGNSGERVEGDSTTLTEGSRAETVKGTEWISVAEGVYINATGGPVKIKASKRIQLESTEGIDLIAPEINIQTAISSSFGNTGLEVMGSISSASMTAPLMSSYQNEFVVGTAFGMFNSTIINADLINSNLYNGNFLGTVTIGTPTPVPPLAIPPVIIPPVVFPAIPIDTSSIDEQNNKIVDELLKTNIESSSGAPKYGFFIPNGVTGDVYKPVSDSNGNLVTLSATGADHELREAIPTGILESVLIKYEAPDGSITQWEVVRPVHIPGELIDNPTTTGMFEDGVRHLARWSKPGAEYPKQMFWIVNGRPMLILDSAERHQCKFGPYNDKIG
jgi:hypothetical protein